MKAIGATALALALAACGKPADTGAPLVAPPTAAPVRTAGPKGTPLTLAGEYRIAGVDGREIDLPYAITASITEGRIRVTADCLNFGWDYSREGNALATERVAVESCARGLTPAEEAVVAAIDAARRIDRTPANGVELTGGGRSLTLFTQ